MIRAIRKEDLAQVAHIERSCFKIPWTKSEWEQEWKQSHGQGWITDDGLGFIWIWTLYENMEVARIGVMEQARKQGYGKQLMDRACSYAKENGCQQVLLEVRVSNIAAIALYTRCGLVISHRAKQAYSDGEDAYVMIGEL